MTDTMPFEWHGRIAPDALDLATFEIVQPSGGTVRPHEGEVVWCRSYGQTISEQLSGVGGAVDAFQHAIRDNDIAAMDRAGLLMAELICQRAYGWTLTDPYTGEPYPQPSAGAEAVYAALPGALFLWLFARLAGIEATADRGNASGASPATSLAKRAQSRRRKAK